MWRRRPRRTSYSREKLKPLPKSGGTTYHFVTGGLSAALAQARSAAGERNVCVLGGADLIRQFIAAGLIDELRIHLAHVLLGSGTRLFEGLDIHGVQFLNTRVFPARASRT
jgi:dihydrofolate reductase